MEGLADYDDTMDGTCEVCARANIKRSPFPSKARRRATKPLERIHSDICGPLPYGHGRFRYFILIIDCYSRFTWEFPLILKSDAFPRYLEFEARAENQLDSKVKAIRVDNAPELISGEMKTHLKKKGVTYERTVPNSSAQNGVAERANWTVCAMARAMLIDSDMSDYFWPFAVQAAVHIKNRVPHSALDTNKTPFEILFKHKPDVSHIRPFGCPVVFRNLKSDDLQKFAPRGINGRFIGYSRDAKGYLIWVPETRQVFVRRDVTFLDMPKLPDVLPEQSTLWEDILGSSPYPKLFGDETNESSKDLRTILGPHNPSIDDDLCSIERDSPSNDDDLDSNEQDSPLNSEE